MQGCSGLCSGVHGRAIDRGAHLGYRRGANGGTWVARFRGPDGIYTTKAIGKADDALDPDGGTVLDFYQAVAHTKEWCRQQAAPKASSDAQSYTVADACRDYLEWFAAHRKSLRRVRNMIDSDILPYLGDEKLANLTPGIIGSWHRKIALSPAKIRTPMGKPQRYRDDTDNPDAPRRRKITANRILAVVKAALNHAYREGKAQSDEAWKRVEPFHNVIRARVRYLERAEALRLLNACRPDFRQLVQGALLTGLRYGEIVRLRVQDYIEDSGTILIEDSKTGKPRHVVLTDEGCEFFAQITAGLSGTTTMFPKQNGKPWGRAEQHRPLAHACRKVRLTGVTFYALRHTYASWAAMAGVPLPVVAAQLGHRDTRMVEKHYAHLGASYVAETIRANLPRLGVTKKSNVATINRPRPVS